VSCILLGGVSLLSCGYHTRENCHDSRRQRPHPLLSAEESQPPTAVQAEDHSPQPRTEAGLAEPPEMVSVFDIHGGCKGMRHDARNRARPTDWGGEVQALQCHQSPATAEYSIWNLKKRLFHRVSGRMCFHLHPLTRLGFTFGSRLLTQSSGETTVACRFFEWHLSPPEHQRTPSFSLCFFFSMEHSLDSTISATPLRTICCTAVSECRQPVNCRLVKHCHYLLACLCTWVHVLSARLRIYCRLCEVCACARDRKLLRANGCWRRAFTSGRPAHVEPWYLGLCVLLRTPPAQFEQRA